MSIGEERKGLFRVIFLVTLVCRETSEAWVVVVVVEHGCEESGRTGHEFTRLQGRVEAGEFDVHGPKSHRIEARGKKKQVGMKVCKG